MRRAARQITKKQDATTTVAVPQQPRGGDSGGSLKARKKSNKPKRDDEDQDEAQQAVKKAKAMERSRDDDEEEKHEADDDEEQNEEDENDSESEQTNDDEEDEDHSAGTSDESWHSAEQEEEPEEDDDSDEDYVSSSEEERRHKRNKKKSAAQARSGGSSSGSGGGSGRTSGNPLQRSRASFSSSSSNNPLAGVLGGHQYSSNAAYHEWLRMNPTAAISVPFVSIINSSQAFDINLQANDGSSTVDVAIGNFVNALEGASDVYNNNSAMWLNELPPHNFSSGTVIVRNVSMRIPAMAGRWKIGHFSSSLGCCGAMFWHTDYVGPDAKAAADLIRDFARSGMEIIENQERDQLRDKGLRLIGRYSWDYYRQYDGGGMHHVPTEAYSLYGGPHCYFVEANNYKNLVYPDILARLGQLRQGRDTRFRPFLARVNETGAMAVFPSQEYLFAKVFLQANPRASTDVNEYLASGVGSRWMGVRAVLIFTYNIGETWQDCRVENVPIDV